MCAMSALKKAKTDGERQYIIGVVVNLNNDNGIVL
jgi:hypothetical protein